MKAIFIIWLRELKKFWRNKSRIIGSLGMPFFFLIFIGAGLDKIVSSPVLGGGNYSLFIMPGIIAMVILFGSIFSGVSVIWDKQFGFMKEMLVAPISRTRIMVGKSLGGATTAVLQAILMLILSAIIGIRPNSIYGFLLAIPLMFLISVSFVALGMAIASKMNDMHGFQLIVNFMIMPIFFLSGALFPLNNVPGWLHILSVINPMRYGVEALRYCLIGSSTVPFFVSVSVLVVFSMVSIALGTILFRRMEI
jgi:ABC-2 type transport system permease protein